MAPDLVGRRLGQYQIVEEIGRGGMAVVYKAYHPALERYVAIKVLPRERSFDREFVARFIREARSAARLKHPNIVTIYDVGQAEGTYFIVMEYVDGPSLTELVEQQETLSPARATEIVSQIASALDYAHQRNFIHRDIKPGNILLDADGTAKLTDFGIVKPSEGTRLTQTGTLLGSPPYMSPEQIRGTEIGHGTDIYSLGVVAYEMLSGRVPFSGPTMAVLHAHVYAEPDLSVLPGSLRGVVGKALAKDPGARYRSAEAFAGALGEALSKATMERQGPPVPIWAWGLIGAVAVLALVIGIATSILPAAQPEPPAPAATRHSPTPAPTSTAGPSTATGGPQSSPSPTREEEGPSPTPFVTPTRDLTMRVSTIGRSAEGRELSVEAIGEPADRAVVLVGSIQGDQPTTRELVMSLSSHFKRNPEQVPRGVALYFLPTLNPDGNVANTRYNANGVDLNRNWDTVDWRSDAAVPGYAEGKPGAGGPRPFSEPETEAAAEFISGLRRQRKQVLVIVLHSSVHRTRGEVYAGGAISLETAHRYAETADYAVEDEWAEYTTSGEMLMWCGEQDILSLDVVIPASQRPSSQVPGTNASLLDLTVDALLDVAGSLGP